MQLTDIYWIKLFITRGKRAEEKSSLSSVDSINGLMKVQSSIFIIPILKKWEGHRRDSAQVS